MSGIGVDRFVVSAAVALLIAGGAAALAEPANEPGGSDPAISAPNASGPATPAAASEPTAAPAPVTQESPAKTETKTETQAETSTPDNPPAPKPVEAAGAAEPAAPASAAATEPATKPAATDGAAGSAPAAAASTPPAPAAAEANAPAANPQTAAASAAPSPDAAIADQLRELAGGKFDRVVANKKDRSQIEAFYAGRNYAPLWITDGTPNARAAAASAYLGHVGADGLEPSDYPVPNFAALSTPADLARAELELTMSVITYTHHASIGRVHWSRVSADIGFDRVAPEPTEVLAGLADAKDVASQLDSYEPHTPGYLALKAKLADIRAGKLAKDVKPTIGDGPVLKVGMVDDRVPQLRQRLGLSGEAGTTYDKPLGEAVKKFQESHQIAATGTLTAATLEAINGKQPDHIEDIVIANMERWRWMPHQFPDTYVIVNLPDFTLRVMHDGKQLWTTRIVDGKPEMPTPIMTAEMKFITVNPTWNVPPSIVNHEYLPALQQDPTVLDRMGLKVDRNADGSIHIYQPPGDKNALGRIRFNFPNKFLVYQHDTPDKYLFAYDKRAYSHGCMRVQDPVHYAEVLLSLVRPGEGYTEDRIRKMFGSGETDIQFPTFIQVDLSYQTAFVDDAGKLEFRDDVYGRDKALIGLLHSEDRKSLDVAIEHPVDVSHREVMAIPDQPSLFGSRGLFGGANYYPNGGGYPTGASSSGGNFFARLFGGFNAAPAPPPRHAAPPHKKVSRSGDTIER